MKITVKETLNIEALRKNPETISKFGLVALQVNQILARYGYAMLSAVPPGSLDIDMVYMDEVSQVIYDTPGAYPLELQIALKEVSSLDISISGNTIVHSEFKELDMDEEFRYETFGWSEELLSIWRLASRAANISLKQIRVAIQSVSDTSGSALIQVIRDADVNPKFDTIPISTIEDFMAACEELELSGVDVVNVVVNKPVPKTKTIIPITYAINPSKYIGMSLRG